MDDTTSLARRLEVCPPEERGQLLENVSVIEQVALFASLVAGNAELGAEVERLIEEERRMHSFAPILDPTSYARHLHSRNAEDNLKLLRAYAAFRAVALEVQASYAARGVRS